MVQVQHQGYDTLLINTTTYQRVILHGDDGAWIDETTDQKELEEFFGQDTTEGADFS